MRKFLLVTFSGLVMFAQDSVDPKVAKITPEQEMSYFKIAYKIQKAQTTMLTAEAAFNKAKEANIEATKEILKLVAEIEKTGCKVVETGDKLSCAPEEKSEK